MFGPNSVNVARYASLIGTKSPTKCDAHLAESNFQTHPRPAVSFTPAGRQDPPARRCPETPGRSAAKSPAYTQSKFHNLSSEPPGPGRI
ncbi:DUF6783 domain-containing protein [Enterocloster sp.]|uniref:DUF6783 domain-containing protein n=1 Tax=Enterocloster sp. TaxID=2719315 RepID=UPI002852EB87|nr:DUF6783 domain-containing protein [Enterocloster sp.]